jgi:general secretion pathway protein G
MGRAIVTTGKDRGQRGFTLIELLIVVTLIVVLAGIGLSTYSTSVTRAREAVLRENLFRIRDSIDQYYADKAPIHLTSPPSSPEILRQVPKDPFTDSADTWQIVMSNPIPQPQRRTRVYDVKRREGVGLDGTPYTVGIPKGTHAGRLRHVNGHLPAMYCIVDVITITRTVLRRSVRSMNVGLVDVVCVGCCAKITRDRRPHSPG